jgi:hypothetical protein
MFNLHKSGFLGLPRQIVELRYVSSTNFLIRSGNIFVLIKLMVIAKTLQKKNFTTFKNLSHLKTNYLDTVIEALLPKLLIRLHLDC